MNTIQLEKWNFHLGDMNDGWYKGYNDSEWNKVTVPHDWSVTMPFSKSYSSGTGYLAGGMGWYRTSFKLSEEQRGKRIFITFDGIYKNASIWCNSYYLGKRPYGYSTYQYDITEQAVFGDELNIIAVKVDHREIYDSRWYTGSGIYRKVTVTALESVHLEWNGQFFTTSEVSSESAQIQISNPIVNHNDFDCQLLLIHKLYYKNSCVHEFHTKGNILKNSSSLIISETTLDSPKLWSDFAPNLYDLHTTIQAYPISNTDDSSDSTTMIIEESNMISVGIRSIHYDANSGFYLNNISTKLKGICVHHDAGCLGAAVTPYVWLRRLLHLKDMGCNAIRMSHNPHMPELYDLCDRLGFLVIDEAFDEWEGVKNKWTTGHNVYPPVHQGYYEEYPTWHRIDLSDLIKRDRNHPSIIMWSIGNEIDYPNDPYCHPLFTSMTGNNDKNKPSSERQYNPDKPNANRLVHLCKQLATIVKEHDSTRPTTAAVAFPELSKQIGFFEPLDVIGYNYKEQYYEDDHKLYPQKPFLGSENSHSYYAWKMARDHEYIAGQYLWTGIDYLGEAHGWPVHGSYAGLLTTAGFPKVSFHRRKSYWTKEPFLYICTRIIESNDTSLVNDQHQEWKQMYRNWNYELGQLIEIRCYTNQTHAKLVVDEDSLETNEMIIKAFDDSKGYISWIIPYFKDTLRVEGLDHYLNPVLEDSISITMEAAEIQLEQWSWKSKIDPSHITYNNILNYRNYHDLIQVEVNILDSIGNRVTNSTMVLFVSVHGGELAGIDNGDLSDNTSFTSDYRSCNEGRMIIYIRPDYKLNSNEFYPVTLEVKGTNLETSHLQIIN